MATAAGNTEPAHGHGGHEAHEEHLSPYPLLIGVGALLAYAGLAYNPFETLPGKVLFFPGLLVFLYAIYGWAIKEDIHFWKTGWVVPGIRPGGRSTGWLGLMFFLGTEVMLFAGLFAAYFALRPQYPEAWAFQNELPIGLVTINTLILLTSGGTMHYALHSIQKDNRKGFTIGMIGTIILGSIFLALQVGEYVELVHHGLTLSSSHFGGIFYLLTGTHGLHVFMGLIMIAMMFYRGLRGNFNSERHFGVDAVAIYWHFVDIVWILLYLIVYVGVI